MAKTQAKHHASDEPKSRALALRAEGYSSEHISELVATPVRTVRQWIARGREVAVNEENPLILDDWVRIIRRSQGMQHTVLDIAEHYAAIAMNDHPGPLAEIARQVASKELMKHALLYNIYAGTGTDKLQKPSQATVQAQNITINFISQSAPDIIEGEVV
jgi:hypothetical protein